jgi:hypothetical protein
VISLVPLLLLAAPSQAADPQKPATHKVYNDLILSCDVSIDDPDRLIVWMDDKPIVVERSKDDVKWAGDPKYWSEGEFVENRFPAEYPPGTPGVNVRCSRHIRITYGNHPQMTDEYVLGNLRMFEECLKLYYLKMGFPVPFESRDPAKRDGKKHKVDVLVGGSNLPPHKGKPMYTAGGCWGCWDGERAMGWLCAGPAYMRHTPPSGATPHELAHACQMHGYVHSPGSGFWWEAHANWMMLQFINTYPPVTNMVQSSNFYMGHGRHYYDCWQIFEHLKDEPGFGYGFVTKLWAEGEDMLYLWNKAEKMAAPRSMADEWGKMVRRSITWDYARHDIFVKQDKDRHRLRHGRITLEPVPAQPGAYRIPWAMAPQQFGHNVCPLKPAGRAVTVDFKGLVHPERGSGWRASLVAVNGAGKPRYGTMWSSGKNTLTLDPDEKELYLVVVATPKVMEIRVEDDYRGLTKEAFPWQVRLEGAEPFDLLALAQKEPPRDDKGNPIAGKPHPNGGGFVADTAKVDATAWVGPHARVLGRAKVTGNARIEDFGEVRDEAQVSDRAVVSGYGLVWQRGKLAEDARVGDYGMVSESASVSGKARVIEYASANGRNRVSGTATFRGRAVSWDDREVSGSAILDGDYANALNVTKGVWFHWFVNDQKKVDAAADLNGLYAQYTFARTHPYLAWDTHGAAHGLLAGHPEVRKDAGLVLNGKDQYVELKRDLAFQADLRVEMKVKREGASEARLFEFASLDGQNRLSLGLTAAGNLKLSVRRDGKESTLLSATPVPSGAAVGMGIGDAGASLTVDGKPSGQDAKLAVRPWDLGLRCGFLGRGLEGGFFKGTLADVSFYSVPK